MLRVYQEKVINEEHKSVFIMAFLKRRLQEECNRQAAEEAKHPDEQAGVMVLTGFSFPDYQSTAAADIAEFDKLLVLMTRAEANAAGAMLLHNGSDTAIDIEKSCAVSSVAREAAINKQLDILRTEDNKDDAISNLLEIALTYAEVGAFRHVMSILKNLPHNTFNEKKVSYGKLFFKALHFGDQEFFAFLIEHGMSASWVDTGNEKGAYMPLQLVIDDLHRCLINMNQLMTECEQSEEKKSKYGTLKDLERLMDKRFAAYSNMINKLFTYKADPNASSDKNMSINHSSHKHAIKLLAEIEGVLKDPELSPSIRVLFEKAIKTLELIAHYSPDPCSKNRIKKLNSGFFRRPDANGFNQPERPPPGFSYF